MCEQAGHGLEICWERAPMRKGRRQRFWPTSPRAGDAIVQTHSYQAHVPSADHRSGWPQGWTPEWSVTSGAQVFNRHRWWTSPARPPRVFTKTGLASVEGVLARHGGNVASWPRCPHGACWPSPAHTETGGADTPSRGRDALIAGQRAGDVSAAAPRSPVRRERRR
jgi:hypothetical protein